MNQYPKSPLLDNYNFIKPSHEFKKSIRRVILAIIIFFIFYMLLIATASIVLWFTIWAGIGILKVRLSFISLAAGAGIISLGVMFFVFLFKFIFSKTKNENPCRVEIKENEHPAFFSFIRKLNEDTQTKFPKKIFLSPDVNAMVFYNSSFWSLFFPVRKNLEIGLGLVNSLNVSEFKAVLAHEFGHFSQKSMKVGSYIYTVNNVIYKLVYEYDKWDNVLSNWAQTDGIFGFFAGITFWLVERVRDLLKIAYNLINLSYMKLSREMEYHADLIAISVSGNESFKNALRKIEFSSFTYNYTSSYLNALASKKKASEDIYLNHTFTTSFLAKHNGISVKDGAPFITDKDIESYIVKSRVNIKDQWASHPTLNERELNISKINIEAEVNKQSAWTIFTTPDEIKKKITRKLYEISFPEIEFKSLEKEEFQNFVKTDINKYKISEDYNDFYEERYPSTFDPKELMNSSSSKIFEEIYSKDNVDKIKRIESNKVDLEVLEQISRKQIQTKHFEFDNKKYKRKHAKKLIDKLKKEIEEEKLFVIEIDKEAFIYHYNKSKINKEENEFMYLYQTYFDAMNTLKETDDINIKFQDFANALYSRPRWTEDEINLLITELSSLEKQFKDFLNSKDIQQLTEHIEIDKQKEEIKKYVRSTKYYSKTSVFDEQSFIDLSDLVNDISASIRTRYGNSLKKMTDFQLKFELKEDKH